MTREEYTKFLDDNNVVRHKCKCCGRDIYYDNSIVRFCTKGKHEGDIWFEGKSFNTTKIINGNPYKLQVCQECLLKKFPNIWNLSRTFNVMSEQTKFAFNIPQELFESSRRKYAMTKEHMIEKYGEEAGLKKWNSYCTRQAETNTYEYKRKTYGMSESDFKKYNASRACTLKNFIKRHGEELGRKKWREYCNRQSYTKSKEYILEKYGEEELIRILNDRKRGMDNQQNFSKISQEFFDQLDKLTSTKYNTYYKNKNYEYSIMYKNHIYLLDYYIDELKICIEFNGDYWHTNPNKYPDDYIHNIIGLTAKQIREKDENRYKLLENKFGIKTYIIWENEYNNGITAKEFIKRIPELQYIINE